MALFRIYDKANRKWMKDDVVIDSSGGVTEVEDHKLEAILADHYLSDEVEIEWATGLYDRDDNMIYVGDIVQDHNGLIGEVYYSIFQARYSVKQLNTTVYYFGLGNKIASYLTIIGNIHGLEREENND